MPENVLRPVLIQLLTAVLIPVIGLLAVDRLVIHAYLWDLLESAKLAIALIVVPKLVALPWTGFKMLRYTERHYQKFGDALAKTGLLAVFFLAVLVISVSTLDAIQSIIYRHSAKTSVTQSRVPEYRLSADMQKKEYSIEGILDFGITRDFRLLLEQHPEGTRVILGSLGGSVFEGRGLAALIQEHRLDTHVSDECSSACTLAFIGGQARTLGGSAKLGFHQYAMDYANLHQVTPFHDPKKEQERDAMFMLERGISKEFIDRIFDRTHQDIWYPDQASLIRFGVVHAIR